MDFSFFDYKPATPSFGPRSLSFASIIQRASFSSLYQSGFTG
jgi:hypothetical protein